MKNRLFKQIALGLLAAGMVGVPLSVIAAGTAGAAGWKAGTAAVVVTPQEPVWMGGYPPTRPSIGFVIGDRNSKSTGKIDDLYIKALALEDPQGNKVVIVTADLGGTNAEIAKRVKAEIPRKYGIPGKAILLNASHTHCAPAIDGAMIEWMGQRYLEVIGKAVESLQPAKLSFSKTTPIKPSPGKVADVVGVPVHGTRYAEQSTWAPFAASRRLPTPDGIVRNYPQVLSDMYLGGLRDDTVPVLRVAGSDGAVKAVLFGYACHPTTMVGTLFSADYPGFAQRYIEEAYPGANAMFAQGCAGNLAPVLRYQVEYAMGHGRALAGAVKSALDGVQTPITGTLRFDYDELPLDLRQPRAGQTELVLRYPIQAFRIGNELLMIGLAGEPVVDYAVTFKSEFLTQFTWVMGYSNPGGGYIPTWRMLKEGGYEARTPFTDTVEKKIVEGVRRLVKNVME